ncbi:MAG: hypothetical protein AAF378_03705 [Cyanobacteria bacterium P01_A01_bin.84]
MSQNQEPTASELAEIIQEFEQYRDRLLNETMEAAKRAKLPKSTVMAKLEPELKQIDAKIQELRDRHAAVTLGG